MRRLSVPLLCYVAGCAVAPPGPLLETGFESDPVAAGWRAAPGPAGVVGQNLAWSDREPFAGRRCLAVLPAPKLPADAGWESPAFPVTEGQYYRVAFRARTEKPAYWAVFFYDRYGALCEGDHYSMIDPAPAWTAQEFFFRTKFPASAATFVARAMHPAELSVDDLRIEPAGRDAVRAWADGVAASMPPLRFSPPPDAGKRLPRTLARLRAGGTLRIACLGDSIANDLGNAALDALLEGAFPGAAVDVRFTGRGGTGWSRHKAQVRERVLEHRPDLLVLLAISNEPDALEPDLRELLARVRELSPGTECLIVTPPQQRLSEPAQGHRPGEILRRVGREAGVEVLDLGGVWRTYLAASDREEPWLLRDAVHLNERGRQLSARALVAHLAAALRG